MNFPKVTDAEVSFGISRLPDSLIAEAQDKGFSDYDNPFGRKDKKL